MDEHLGIHKDFEYFRYFILTSCDILDIFWDTILWSPCEQGFISISPYWRERRCKKDTKYKTLKN